MPLDPELFHNLFNALPDPIFYKDLKGVYLGANRAYSEVYGLSSEELMGKRDSELFGAEQAQYHVQSDERVRAGELFRNEVPLQLPNQEIAVFENIKTLFHNDAGQAQGIIGIGRDITKRHRLRQNLETLLEICPLPLAIGDYQNNKILMANQAMQDFQGVSRERILNTPVDMLSLTPERRQEMLAVLAEYGGFRGFEVQVRRLADGQAVWVSMSAESVHFAEHEAVMVLIENIEKRKQAEQQLKQAHAISQQALEVKNRLLEMASHDLRNPLTSIQLLSEMMEMQADSLDSDTIRQYSQDILRNVRRMLAEMNQLLEKQQLERQALRVRWESVALSQLCQEMLNSYQAQALKKQIHLAYEGPQGLKIQSDTQLLTRVLDNLLSNALKYTPGQGTVRLVLKQIGDQVSCAISDTGPGFTAEDQRKMYAPFTQLSAQPTGQELSVGLGLSIVKQLTQALKIDLELESNPGEGSCFILHFRPLS